MCSFNSLCTLITCSRLLAAETLESCNTRVLYLLDLPSLFFACVFPIMPWISCTWPHGLHLFNIEQISTQAGNPSRTLAIGNPCCTDTQAPLWMSQRSSTCNENHRQWQKITASRRWFWCACGHLHHTMFPWIISSQNGCGCVLQTKQQRKCAFVLGTPETCSRFKCQL